MSNPLFVLDLLFEILDGLYWVNLKSDGITCFSLNINLYFLICAVR